MEQIQRIFNDLKDSNEIAIIERYGRNAKYYTATLTSNIAFFNFFRFSILINLLLEISVIMHFTDDLTDFNDLDICCQAHSPG